MKLNYFNLIILFSLFVSVNNAQIDIKDFNVLTIGAGIKNTGYQGFYSKTKIRPQGAFVPETITSEFVKENGKTISPELAFYVSNDNTAATINMDVIVHLIGLVADVKNSHSERMSNGIFANMFSVPSPILQSESFPTDISKDKRFWCHDMLDINACFGSKKLTYGFNVGWKAIGWTFPGTYITNNGNTYRYDFTGQGDQLNRFKIGPSLCFRTGITEKVALMAFGGFNYMPNIFGDPKYSRRFVNPYLKGALFFGGKYGAALTFSYQYLKAKNEEQIISTSYSGSSVVSETKGKPDLIISQYEVKLALYISDILGK